MTGSCSNPRLLQHSGKHTHLADRHDTAGSDPRAEHKEERHGLGVGPDLGKGEEARGHVVENVVFWFFFSEWKVASEKKKKRVFSSLKG
jgi:hypothetical protein